MQPSLLSPTLLALGLLLSGTAAATPSAPATLRDHLGLSCRVECTVCHTTSLASRGNATRPLALALVDELTKLELDITEEGALERALDVLAESGSDADGDQLGDIEELLAEPPADPSEPGAAPVCAGEVGYGCGAEFAGRPPGGPLLLGLGTLAVFALRRRFARG